MKIELNYVKVGDYYLPDLTAEPRPDRSLGKYGLMRLQYLEEHRPIVWTKLVMDGKLYAHLLETEDAANDLLDSMKKFIIPAVIAAATGLVAVAAAVVHKKRYTE